MALGQQDAYTYLLLAVAHDFVCGNSQIAQNLKIL